MSEMPASPLLFGIIGFRLWRFSCLNSIPQESASTVPRTTKSSRTGIGKRRNSRLERLDRRTTPWGACARATIEVMKMTSLRVARLLGWLLLALVVMAVPGRSFAQGIGVSITVAPPLLPVYVQPICPGEGYLWTPGYWAWDDAYGDYYWVPGTWVLAPEVGFLWTPGYWGWGDGVYIWNAGYWGDQVGFYGGVFYGFGYVGTGYEGGYWRGGNFFYNTSVMNVNTTIIHNTYNRTVINNTTVNRVSYNGGNGGTNARPTAQQQSYASGRHLPATTAQTRHQQAAASNRSLRASVNHGKPPIAATARPANFKTGVAAARAGDPHYTRTASNRANVNHAATSTHTTARSSTAAKTASTPHASTAKTASRSSSSRPATTAHANARRTEAKPAPAPHANTAKTESKPSRPTPPQT